MIMGKKLRKENDVSAFGESQTPFTFPTVSSNQKENEKKVPSDKINLRHFPIWFLITFHSMHFYCQLLLCSVGFFHFFVFFLTSLFSTDFLGCTICLSFCFHAHFAFRTYAKSEHVFMLPQRRLHSLTQIRIYEKHLRHQHNSLAIFFRGFRVFFSCCKTFNRLCSLLT